MLKKRYNTRNMIILSIAAFAFAMCILALINGRVQLPRTQLTAIVIAVAGVIVFAALSLTVGRDVTITDVPSDYPPEDITPAQAGCLQDGQVGKREFISSFYYLAQKGYILIEEYELQKFRIVRRNNPDHESRHMRILFEALFQGADDAVTISDAAERLRTSYAEFNKAVIKSITSKKNREIAEMTGRVNGFHSSLTENSAQKYDELTQKDSGYMEKILPYAYAFAVTSKLPSKFENTDVSVPEWYKPYGVSEGSSLDVVIYNAMLRNLRMQLEEEVLKGIREFPVINR